jgi:hypothetical protein
MKFVVRAGIVAALLVPAVVFAGDKGKKKKTVPAVFGTARYVYVQAEDGDVFNPGLLPEDRQAIVDVEDALRKWNRYTITINPDEAELIFYVRKGRLASAKVGGTVGSPGGRGRGQGQGPNSGQQRTGGLGGPGVIVGGEAGPPDDLLEVRMHNSDNDLSAPIWQRSQPDGLNAPMVALLAQLKEAVEKDYPQ